MKRFKNILFYTDGRGDSDPALSRAVELAQRNHGQLTVLGVLQELPRELSRLVGGIHPVDLQESAMRELRERLEQLVESYRKVGNPAATETISDGDGRWVKEMTVPPGAYEYLFVVDGEWVEDPRATESAPNPFNRNNSVVRAGELVVGVY